MSDRWAPGLAGASHRATAAGLATSTFAFLCCAGVAPVLGLVSAVGLGFLIRDAVLIPILILALGLTLRGMWLGRRCHGRNGPALLGVLGSALTLAGLLVWVPLAFAGFAVVIGASIWNILAVRACAVGARPTRQVIEEGDRS
ncbi:MAG: MerC domain-containing protein [Gemmatimonadales bacterium]